MVGGRSLLYTHAFATCCASVCVCVFTNSVFCVGFALREKQMHSLKDLWMLDFHVYFGIGCFIKPSLIEVDICFPWQPQGQVERSFLAPALPTLGDYTYPMCVCNLCHMASLPCVWMAHLTDMYLRRTWGVQSAWCQKHKCAPALELLLQHVHLICRALILIESLMSIIMMRIFLEIFIPPYIFAGMLTDKYCEY